MSVILYFCCSFAQSVDGILEEEEQYADQLKEYLAFADSLRSGSDKWGQGHTRTSDVCLLIKGDWNLNQEITVLISGDWFDYRIFLNIDCKSLWQNMHLYCINGFIACQVNDFHHFRCLYSKAWSSFSWYFDMVYFVWTNLFVFMCHQFKISAYLNVMIYHLFYHFLLPGQYAGSMSVCNTMLNVQRTTSHTKRAKRKCWLVKSFPIDS